MKKITIVGVGKIGTLIGLFLTRSTFYRVQLLDQSFESQETKRLFDRYPQLKADAAQVDITDAKQLETHLKSFKPQAVISCLPFHLTRLIAKAAKKSHCHYFDLTEDTATTACIKELAEGASNLFVPQCGLAPGMVNLIANDLMQQFSEIDTVALRVGALPQFSSHGLKYALTWSTEGLINEYDRPCQAIYDRQKVFRAPLEELETIELFGDSYEAFNTSGGLGSLVELYEGKVQQMNYKSIRYPGHCERMKFLLQDLKLREDKLLLKKILENSLPRTYQDMILLVVRVTGLKDEQFLEKYYMKKILPEVIDELEWSAIQVATASGVCAVVDVVLSQEEQFSGLVFQEKLSFDAILKSMFGLYYRA